MCKTEMKKQEKRFLHILIDDVFSEDQYVVCCFEWFTDAYDAMWHLVASRLDLPDDLKDTHLNDNHIDWHHDTMFLGDDEHLDDRIISEDHIKDFLWKLGGKFTENYCFVPADRDGKSIRTCIVSGDAALQGRKDYYGFPYFPYELSSKEFPVLDRCWDLDVRIRRANMKRMREERRGIRSQGE